MRPLRSFVCLFPRLWRSIFASPGLFAECKEGNMPFRGEETAEKCTTMLPSFCFLRSLSSSARDARLNSLFLSLSRSLSFSLEYWPCLSLRAALPNCELSLALVERAKTREEKRQLKEREKAREREKSEFFLQGGDDSRAKPAGALSLPLGEREKNLDGDAAKKKKNSLFPLSSFSTHSLTSLPPPHPPTRPPRNV